jgi:hypothetical protein
MTIVSTASPTPTITITEAERLRPEKGLQDSPPRSRQLLLWRLLVIIKDLLRQQTEEDEDKVTVVASISWMLPSMDKVSMTKP